MTNTTIVLHPLRPSQIKASQKNLNIKTIPNVKRSESSRLPRHFSMDTTTIKQDLLKTATHNSQRISKVEKQALVQRLATTKTSLNESSKMATSVKMFAQMCKSTSTATEKSQSMMLLTNSVSTASRPALIKTGSSSSSENKPRWI